jgi:hypothetical protein
MLAYERMRGVEPILTTTKRGLHFYACSKYWEYSVDSESHQTLSRCLLRDKLPFESLHVCPNTSKFKDK